MKIFISGGCKNGKSTHAQELAKRQQKINRPLYYVATMKPTDSEDIARIKRHICERDGMGFETVEISRDIKKLASICDNEGSFLLDSITALLANEMFDGKDFNDLAAIKIGEELSKLLDSLTDIVIVSDYIYSDAAEYDRYTEDYRKGLAHLDKICAKKCDVVLEVCFGNMVIHKGGEQYETII
ncbi:MAG: bifunctional adenosylcobinamide kinase/adenosylcobinamide-phosphate guanylyltransferase [Cellulosilyticaceae bacterium]